MNHHHDGLDNHGLASLVALPRLFGHHLSLDPDKIMMMEDDDDDIGIPSPPRSSSRSHTGSPFEPQQLQAPEGRGSATSTSTTPGGRRTPPPLRSTGGFPAVSLFSTNHHGNSSNKKQQRPPLSCSATTTTSSCSSAATSSSRRTQPRLFGTATAPHTPTTTPHLTSLTSSLLVRKRSIDELIMDDDDDIDDHHDDDICLTNSTGSNTSTTMSLSAPARGRVNNNKNNNHYHLSPSIMTMDGRILQSKNPFSSPIAMETSHYLLADGSAPSIPGMYYYNQQHTNHNSNNNNHQDNNNNTHDPTKLRRTDGSLDVRSAKHDHHPAPPRPHLQMKSSQRQLPPPPPPKTPAKKKKPLKSSPTWLQPRQSHSNVHDFLHPNATNDNDTNATNSNTSSNNSRFANDFDVIQQLGRGCFGTVVSVMSRLDGCLYAVKIIPHGDGDIVQQEIYALAALSEVTNSDEPAVFHIVRYHQSWREGSTVFIQTELCSGTVAQQLLSSSSSTSSRVQPRKLLYQMLLALEFIHRHDMCHLDIKPDSCVYLIYLHHTYHSCIRNKTHLILVLFFTPHPFFSDIFIKNDQYKLGDFGLVTTRATSPKLVQEGDSRYMAFELLQGTFTDLTKCDIFSLGITLYEIISRLPLPSSGEDWHRLRHNELFPLVLPPTQPQQSPVPPPHNNNPTTDTTKSNNSIVEGHHHADTDDDSASLLIILQEMMRRDATLRPTAAALLSSRHHIFDHGQHHHHHMHMMHLLHNRNNNNNNNNMMMNHHPMDHTNAQLPPPAGPPPRQGALTRANTWSVGTASSSSSWPQQQQQQ
jgi:serine/threonine protein kinase